ELEVSEVNQLNFIPLAAPLGSTGNYELVIVEQLYDQYACWVEDNSEAVRVRLLNHSISARNFCRVTKSDRHHSILLDNEDLTRRYRLKLIEDDGQLVLVGSLAEDAEAFPVEIGRTRSIAEGYQKIFLNPGWRFTRNTEENNTTADIYLTGEVATIETPLPSTLLPPEEIAFTAAPLPSQVTQPQLPKLEQEHSFQETIPSTESITDPPTIGDNVPPEKPFIPLPSSVTEPPRPARDIIFTAPQRQDDNNETELEKPFVRDETTEPQKPPIPDEATETEKPLTPNNEDNSKPRDLIFTPSQGRDTNSENLNTEPSPTPMPESETIPTFD
ncbi:MAG: DUF3747 domain-containing protein, partial [Okeania sp. SIO2D1]|nr:DUF3747 domain-containing protein [Okeania sp. SIO2D1]